MQASFPLQSNDGAVALYEILEMDLALDSIVQMPSLCPNKSSILLGFKLTLGFIRDFELVSHCSSTRINAYIQVCF